MKNGKITLNPYLHSHRYANKLVARLITPAKKSPDEKDEFDKIFSLIDDDFRKGALDYYRFMGYELPVNTIIRSISNVRAYLTNNVRTDDKLIVAVGGKFTCGKSTFLNSIIDRGEYLPTHLRECSVVPTYIYYDPQQTHVIGETIDGRLVMLNENILATISHQFEAKFNFNMSNLLSRMHISIDCPQLGKMVFIDTPGTGNTRSNTSGLSDTEVATQSINDADFVLWLVNINDGEIAGSERRIFDNIKKPKILFFTQAKNTVSSRITEIVTKAREIHSKDKDLLAIVVYDSLKKKIYQSVNLRDNRPVDTIGNILSLLNKTASESPVETELAIIKTIRKDVNEAFLRSTKEYKTRLSFIGKKTFQAEIPDEYINVKKPFLEGVLKYQTNLQLFLDKKLKRIEDDLDFQIKKKIKINIDNNHEDTPECILENEIREAIRKKDMDLFCETLQIGVDPFQEWTFGYNLLTYVAAWGTPAMLNILMDEQVDLTCKNKKGETLLDAAINNNNQDVIRWLAVNLPFLFMEEDPLHNWKEILRSQLPETTEKFIDEIDKLIG